MCRRRGGALRPCWSFPTCPTWRVVGVVVAMEREGREVKSVRRTSTVASLNVRALNSSFVRFAGFGCYRLGRAVSVYRQKMESTSQLLCPKMTANGQRPTMHHHHCSNQAATSRLGRLSQQHAAPQCDCVPRPICSRPITPNPTLLESIAAPRAWNVPGKHAAFGRKASCRCQDALYPPSRPYKKGIDGAAGR